MKTEPSVMDEFPEVIKKGTLSCKISVLEGKKCSDRSWKPVFAVLKQNELYLTRDRESHSVSVLQNIIYLHRKQIGHCTLALCVSKLRKYVYFTEDLKT